MCGFDSSSRYGMLLFAFVIGANVAIVVHLPARCDLAIPADSILGTATRDMGAMRLNRYGGEGPKASESSSYGKMCQHAIKIERHNQFL